MTDILTQLEAIIRERKSANPDESYVAKRFKQGTEKIVQKFGEESVETIIAAMKGSTSEIVSESADMLFHWVMLLVNGGASVVEVMGELERRLGTSGLDEKARRKMKE